jgi:hypothetical protein
MKKNLAFASAVKCWAARLIAVSALFGAAHSQTETFSVPWSVELYPENPGWILVKVDASALPLNTFLEKVSFKVTFFGDSMRQQAVGTTSFSFTNEQLQNFKMQRINVSFFPQPYPLARSVRGEEFSAPGFERYGAKADKPTPGEVTRVKPILLSGASPLTISSESAPNVIGTAPLPVSPLQRGKLSPERSNTSFPQKWQIKGNGSNGLLTLDNGGFSWGDSFDFKGWISSPGLPSEAIVNGHYDDRAGSISFGRRLANGQLQWYQGWLVDDHSNTFIFAGNFVSKGLIPGTPRNGWVIVAIPNH